MRFQITKSALEGPVKAVASVAQKSNSKAMPILSHLRLEASQDGALTLTATNLDTELCVKVHGEVAEPGCVTVPAAKLRDICTSLADEAVIHCQLDGEKMRLRAGKSRLTLSCLDAEGFPQTEIDDYQLCREIEPEALRRVLGKIQSGMGRSDVRYYLNGAYFRFEGERLTVVGTDGHRLHLANTDTAEVSTGGYTLPAALLNSELSSADGHCILAREAVSVLLRQLAGARDKAILSVSTNHFEIRHGAFRLTTKLVEGEYPNYERIIPKNGVDPIIVGRELLHSALSRVNILAHEKHHGGKLAFSEGALQVSSANEGHEAAQERFAISYAGEAFDAGFNIGYLIDILGVIDSEEVAININPGEGALFRPSQSGDTSLFVVMPMRL